MTAATQDDAHLLLKCAELYIHMDLGSVSSWLWEEDFPTTYAEFTERVSSEEFDRFRAYVGYFETLGTLWKHQLLNEELLLDWLLIPWDRISGIVLGMREAAGVDRLFENFEALGARQAELNG